MEKPLEIEGLFVWLPGQQESLHGMKKSRGSCYFLFFGGGLVKSGVDNKQIGRREYLVVGDRCPIDGIERVFII